MDPEEDQKLIELKQALNKQSINEIELDKQAMKKRANISNLPQEKVKQLADANEKKPPLKPDFLSVGDKNKEKVNNK